VEAFPGVAAARDQDLQTSSAGYSWSNVLACVQNFFTELTRPPDPYIYLACLADRPCQNIQSGLGTSNEPREILRCKRDNTSECTTIGLIFARGGVDIHGNSYDSPETTYLYMLEDKKTGKFLKWGITKDPNARYSGEVKQQTVMRIVAEGDRADMAAVERVLILSDAGPWNREPFARTAMPPGVEEPVGPEVVP
jgi:hypothetical protein